MFLSYTFLSFFIHSIVYLSIVAPPLPPLPLLGGEVILYLEFENVVHGVEFLLISIGED